MRDDHHTTRVRETVWLTERLRYRLVKEGFDPAPSTAAIGRALRRLGADRRAERRQC